MNSYALHATAEWDRTPSLHLKIDRFGSGAKTIFSSLFWRRPSLLGYLLRQGQFTPIDFPKAIYTSAIGINPQGDNVERYHLADGVDHGFLLTGGMRTGRGSPIRSNPTAIWNGTEMIVSGKIWSRLHQHGWAVRSRDRHLDSYDHVPKHRPACSRVRSPRPTQPFPLSCYSRSSARAFHRAPLET